MDFTEKQQKIKELILSYDKENAAYNLALNQKTETDSEDTNRLTMLSQSMIRSTRRMEEIRKDLNRLGHQILT